MARQTCSIAMVALAATLGCSSSKTQSAADAAMTSALIPTSGGTLTTSDGVSVVVPANALPTATTLTATEDATGVPSGTFKLQPSSTETALAVGPAFDIGPAGTTFASPVTITLPFDPTKLPAGTASSAVTIVTAEEATPTDFTALTTTVVDSTHVSAQTSTFCVFVPVVQMPSGGGGGGCGSNTECGAGQLCVNGTCQAQ
jgi:hypothetical protein